MSTSHRHEHSQVALVATEAVVVDENTAQEVETHAFVCDASDLNIPPGVVPERIPTTLGNRLDFLLVARHASRFKYAQANGCLRLTVFND